MKYTYWNNMSDDMREAFEQQWITGYADRMVFETDIDPVEAKEEASMQYEQRFNQEGWHTHDARIARSNITIQRDCKDF